MKKICLAVIGIFISLNLALGADKEVNSKIDHVTVFLKGAQVNRSAKVDVKTGRTKLLFKGLTSGLDANSVSVKVDGTVKVLSINQKKDYLDKHVKSPRIKKLSDSIELMEMQLEDIVVELNLLSSRETFARANYRVRGDNGIDPVALVKVSEFFNKEIAYVRKATQKQKRKYNKINTTLSKYRNQLRALINKQIEETSVVEVLVEAIKSSRVDFKLSYVVYAAGWQPSYDVRAQDITKPIEIAYKATMFQNTGIDWDGVKLTFSNGNPYRNNIMPKMNPYYLRYISNNVYRNKRTNYGAKNSSGYFNVQQSKTVRGLVLDSKTGEPIPFASVIVNGTTQGTYTDAEGRYQIEVPANRNYLTINTVGYNASNVSTNTGYSRVLLASRQTNLEAVVVADRRRSRADRSDEIDDVEVLEESKVYNMPAKNIGSAAVVTAKKSRSYGLIGNRSGRKNKSPSMYKSNSYAKSAGNATLNTQAIVKPVSLEFAIDELYTVKSTGKPMIVEMKNISIDAAFEYRSIPKLNEAAYLITMIPEWTKYNFIDGQANLYFENTYVGKTSFELASMSDTLSISLGIDKSIQVKRTKVKDYTSKQFIGSNKIEKREFEIEVKNTKKAGIDLVLYDQIPLSNIEEIQVSVSEISGAKKNDKTGQLEWRQKLEPGKKVMKKVSYSVKYPKGRFINLE